MFYFDDKMLVVGNFKKILSLSDTNVIFSFKKYNLSVCGESLIMPYLEDREVGIKGIIKTINIEYKSVKDDA